MIKTFNQFMNEADIKGNPAVSPEYLASLNKRAEASAQEIEQRLGRDMGNLMRFVMEVQSMQRGKEKQLEELTTSVIKEQYGSILGNTELDIRIPTNPREMEQQMNKIETSSADAQSIKDIEDEDTQIAIHKRKILNMIAQGEAINSKKMLMGETNMNGLTEIFGEASAARMVDLLVRITDICNARDWRIPEEVGAAMIENGSSLSGISKIEWKPKEREEDFEESEESHEGDTAKLTILGLDQAMLFHEAVKAIYGLINQGGLAHLDDETVAKVFINADTARDEVQDLKRSKLTAADLRDFINTFSEVDEIENGREYVWGKMIDATVVPDREFLELMRLIFTAAPLYRQLGETEPAYLEDEIASAREAMPKAKAIVQRLIQIIKDELSEWEESLRGSEYDDLEEPSVPIQGVSSTDDSDLELSQSEIQDLIDQALDRNDFSEFKRLSKLLAEESSYWIQESVQVAKAFMLKRLADRLRKSVQDLTPEEQNQALTDPTYTAVISLLGDRYRGYAGAFVNFAIGQRIPINQLTLLLQKIADNREFISSLPHTIDEYSKGNPDSASNLSGFEALMDQFAQIEFRRKGKWIIDKLPRAIRDKARVASPEETAALFRLGAVLADEPKEIQLRLMKKSNQFIDKPISAFIEYANRFADSQKVDGGAHKLADQAEELSPSVNVIYADDRYVALSVRTEDAQKALCSAANWCINTWAWKQYSKGAVQINIFDFGVPTTDPLHITGTTIYYQGKVRTSHDINDTNIMKSSEPAQHFKGIGYPPELVESITMALPAECAVKRVLDEGLSSGDKTKLFKEILFSGFSIDISDPTIAEYAEREIVDVINQRFSQGKADPQDFIDAFKRHGILSVTGAKFYEMIRKNHGISEEDRSSILERTLKGMELVQSSLAGGLFDGSPDLKKRAEVALTAKDRILKTLSGQ